MLLQENEKMKNGVISRHVHCAKKRIIVGKTNTLTRYFKDAKLSIYQQKGRPYRRQADLNVIVYAFYQEKAI